MYILKTYFVFIFYDSRSMGLMPVLGHCKLHTVNLSMILQEQVQRLKRQLETLGTRSLFPFLFIQSLRLTLNQLHQNVKHLALFQMMDPV